MVSIYAKRGQTWRWYQSNDVYYHCLLLEMQTRYEEGQKEVWTVLDLDTGEAGRITTAQLFLYKVSDSWWERIA